MKLKNKLKRFFTLSRNHDGFTLVELIVVIAVLAILGGASVPAYNLYIKKARESADQQLIAAVNNAFASACLENKLEIEDVESAKISVVAQKVYGMSSMNPTDPTLSSINEAFLRYYEGNKDATFVTENINSLDWVKEDNYTGFKISQSYVDMLLTLSDGSQIRISAEDMEAIQNSTYADMGYSGVAEAISNVSKSGGSLARLCGTFGLAGKLTNAMKAFGLIDDNKAEEIEKNLKISNIREESYATATKEVENGLTMVTAKYLASGGNIQELLEVQLGNSSIGVIRPLASGTGGTKTVSAIAVQYALAEGFANSDAAQGVTIDGKSVSDYLASSDDPVNAISKVQATNAYQNSYKGSEQYNNDVNGFVGTMSILGDNIGTITNPGAVDINDYLSNGIYSEDAKDALTGVLGE